MRIFMAGAAALALAATGAAAQGKGNGNGNNNPNDNGKPPAAQPKGNGGPMQADRGPQKAPRGNPGNGTGPGVNQRMVDRGPAQANRGNGNDNANGAVSTPKGNRSNGNGNAASVSAAIRDRVQEQGNRDIRRDARVVYENTKRVRDGNWLSQDRDRGLINGCPPGLAKKNNGCNPPGQVRNRYERNVFGFDYGPSLFGLNNYDRRGDYAYNDGYLVRYGNDGGIASWLPLLGGALGVGNIWPSGYQSYNVPDYYVDYYDLGGPDRYRYADNVIYRVNPQDDAITSIAALITGDDISVGQPMPSGYDVYNVPYSYRDRYYDTPDRMYRYSDGRIFQVDPQTRLVAAVIDLLV